nr:meiotically up-regulated gene 14 protein [Quercus suber]
MSVRDPILPDHFWLNPLSKHFSQICVSDLILVNEDGQVVEGDEPINAAAFAIHSEIHKARPDVHAGTCFLSPPTERFREAVSGAVQRTDISPRSVPRAQRVWQGFLGLRPQAGHDHAGQLALLQRPRSVPAVRRRGAGSRGRAEDRRSSRDREGYHLAESWTIDGSSFIYGKAVLFRLQSVLTTHRSARVSTPRRFGSCHWTRPATHSCSSMRRPTAAGIRRLLSQKRKRSSATSKWGYRRRAGWRSSRTTMRFWRRLVEAFCVKGGLLDAMDICFTRLRMPSMGRGKIGLNLMFW